MKTNLRMILFSTLLTASFTLAAHPALSQTKKQDSKQASRAKANARTLSQEQRELRLLHARELLGRHYSRSVVRHGEDVQKINNQVYRWTKQHLPKKYKGQYKRVAQAIIDESLKYGFDPVFLMSVIIGESSFHPEMIGGVGEIGLMQIRPTTGKWIAAKYNLPWKGKSSLRDPVQNIQLGSAYLGWLRDRFDSHARLYLAAYNMGQRNVDRALAKKIWPKDYPAHVMKHYITFYSDVAERQRQRERTRINIAKN